MRVDHVTRELVRSADNDEPVDYDSGPFSPVKTLWVSV